MPYELLPPGTPPSELRPLIRMLTPTTQGDVVTPWSDVFRSGTAISKALQLAQDMLEGDNVKNGTILLISDLETSPDDVPATARVLRSIKQAGTPVQLLALGPSSDARTLFGGILGPDAFTPFVERPDETAGSAAAGAALAAGAPARARRALPRRARVARALRGPPRAARRPAGGGDGVRSLVLRRELLLVLAVAAFVAAGLPRRSSPSTSTGGGRRSPRTTCATACPRPTTLWSPDTVAPLDAGRRLLGVEDDVAFRQALRALRASELDDPTVSDPNLAVQRTEAAERLESIVVHDRDDERRSRAANLLGVLGDDRVQLERPVGRERSPDRSELLLNAIASFEQAIAIDPGNDEAKYNLQVILLRGQGLLPTEASAGRNPAPGGRGARGAGAGQPGSGY